MIYHAVIVAGGSGSRTGGRKQWMELAGKPVIAWSIDAFAEHGAATIVVVVPQDDLATAKSLLDTRAIIVTGGASRAESVAKGLAAVAGGPTDIVMIHDAARPLLGRQHITSLLERLAGAPAAILALPLADSIKREDAGHIVATPARDGLWRAQTPQAFRLDDILGAYAALPGDATPTDDAEVAGRAGIAVALVVGDMRLHKLTFPEDFSLLETFISKDKPLRQIRIGQGFDAHRWGAGTSVWLCGVEIEHDQTLIGHSDADAGLHALTDALLGAAGLGDIGDHFPPSDPQWKGVASDRFLRHALDLVAQKGGSVVNVDVTLICERPKIKTHREAMRQRLADILGIAVDRVSVKATTTEGMGFTGRQEGLAAQAVCAIEI